MANVGLPVAPVQSMLLPRRGMSAVTVWLAENATLIVALSWGRGTRLVQALADQLPPEVPDQVWVAAVVKVMLVFPPASPEFPVIPDKSQLIVPAPVISLKSTLVRDEISALLVMVLAVPKILLVTKSLLTTESPFKLRPLLAVWLALSCNWSVFTAVPVLVKVPKVLAPEMAAIPEPVRATVP